MGALIDKVLNSLGSGKRDTKMLMLGLDGAGKTTILYKLKLGENLQTVPTIGFNVEAVQYKRLKMTVWDIGGQTHICKLWHHYFQGTQALVYVLDTSDEDRIQLAKETIHQLCQHEDLKDVPVMIYGNKSDVSNVKLEQLVQKMDLNSLRRNWYVQMCCALNGEGLYEGLDWLNKELQK